MSRKHCKRRVIKPVNPIALGIARAAITDTESLDRLRLRELTTLEAISTGRGTDSDWREMVDVVNVAQTLAEMGVGRELLPLCERAEEALLAALTDYKKTGRVGFDGTGLQTMRELVQMYDLQRSSISNAQYLQAVRKTVAKINGAPASVKVEI